jgi:lipopolysaccharide/colanic/teichoic acid biosynthesis glycosyltransferase
MANLQGHFSSQRKIHDTEILDERLFTQLVCLERRRSDRSGRPFLLVLLDVANLVDTTRREPDLLKKLTRALELCIRQTDLVGWYRADSVIGVIFTEISGDDGVVQLILGKIRQALDTNLPPDHVDRITVSAHTYPDDFRSTTPSAVDSELYPDFQRSNSALLFKRAIDLMGGLTLLVILSPLFLLTALAIKLTSRGPVFFRQTRIGQYGKPFTFLKFRSMYTNTDSKIHKEYVRRFIGSGREGEVVAGSLLEGGLYKLRSDPRVTPLGRVLRKTSIDELPQLLNVVRGEMSLVGPRPPVPYEFDCYDTWHKRRVREGKPGITGLWQVKGRSRTTFNEMVRLDLKYLNEWSIGSDLKILVQTPWAVLNAKGAC